MQDLYIIAVSIKLEIKELANILSKQSNNPCHAYGKLQLTCEMKFLHLKMSFYTNNRTKACFTSFFAHLLCNNY